MAWSSAILSATESARRALDKPLLVGRNWMRTSGITTRWNQTGSWATGDSTATLGARTYGYDEFDHLRTYPASAQQTWYFLIDFGSALDNIDCVALLNPYGLSGVRIKFQVADNDAYDSNLSTLCEVTPASAARVVQLDLHHTGSVPLRYSGVRYCRFEFYLAATCTPKVGEFIVGRSRQLPYKPTAPFDKNNLKTRQSITVSDSGVISAHVFNKKQRQLSADFTLDLTADQTDFETFWETEIDGGTLPYLWIDDPTTYPSNANWMRETDPAFAGPIQAGNVRKFRVQAVEQGPNYLKLGV